MHCTAVYYVYTYMYIPMTHMHVHVHTIHVHCTHDAHVHVHVHVHTMYYALQVSFSPRARSGGGGALSVPGDVNVEESLSPASLSLLKEKKSLLAERLQASSLRHHAGLPSTPLADFTELEMPRYTCDMYIIYDVQCILQVWNYTQ